MKIGSITVDLLFRCGIVVGKTRKGEWQVAPNWEERRIMLFVDAKTVRNITKFPRKVSGRGLSFRQASVYDEIF